MQNHTPQNFLKKEFSAGCQPRYPVKIPITTWKSLSPPRGLQLYPSCQARCPVKTSYEMENYPAPSAAQLLTMLLHREHFCSYLYNTQFSEKINKISNMGQRRFTVGFNAMFVFTASKRGIKPRSADKQTAPKRRTSSRSCMFFMGQSLFLWDRGKFSREEMMV